MDLEDHMGFMYWKSIGALGTTLMTRNLIIDLVKLEPHFLCREFLAYWNCFVIFATGAERNHRTYFGHF